MAAGHRRLRTGGYLGTGCSVGRWRTQHGAFKIVYLDDRGFPEAELFAIQHLTPEVLWQEGLLDHPNTATGLRSVSIVSPDTAVTADRLSRFGVSQSHGPHGDRFDLDGGGWIDVMTEQAAAKAFPGVALPAMPCAIASSYSVESLSAVADLLGSAQVAHHRSSNLVRVMPDAAEGCVVDFVET